MPQQERHYEERSQCPTGKCNFRLLRNQLGCHILYVFEPEHWRSDILEQADERALPDRPDASRAVVPVPCRATPLAKICYPRVAAPCPRTCYSNVWPPTQYATGVAYRLK